MAERNKTVQWAEYMRNPHLPVLTGFFENTLSPEGVAKHAEIIERLSLSLATRKDLEQFSSLMSDLFEGGYMLSAHQHAVELAKHGIHTKVVPPTRPSPTSTGKKIFDEED